MKKTKGSIIKRGKVYSVAWMHEGQRHFAPIEDTEGNRPKNMTEARAMADNMLRPFTLPDTAERLAALAARADTVKAAANALAPGLPLVRVWTEYLAARNRPDTGGPTLRQYGFQWDMFTDWVKDHASDLVNMSDVTIAHAHTFMAHLEKEGYAPRTQNGYANLFALVWRVLAEPGHAPVNPWTPEHITRRTLSKNGGRKELSIDQLKKVCEDATGELRTLLAVGLYTGLRLGDACALTWEEIDLARGVAVVTPRKTARTSGATAAIPIGPALRRVLESLPGPRTGPVMPGYAAMHPKDPRAITEQVKAHFKTCGLTPNEAAPGRKRARVLVGFHSMRHSFITYAAAAGWPESLVRAIVGHTSVDVTRRYLHMNVLATASLPTLPDVLADAPEAKALPDRAPLPGWARETIEGMTGKNWKKARVALLHGSAPQAGHAAPPKSARKGTLQG